jgi:hypothetical protein
MKPGNRRILRRFPQTGTFVPACPHLEKPQFAQVMQPSIMRRSWLPQLKQTLALLAGIPPPFGSDFDRLLRFCDPAGRMDCGFCRTFIGCALDGNRGTHRFTLSNACKDLRCLESMANAATVTITKASAAKNSFAGAVAQGGAGPEDYVPQCPT